MVNDKMRRLLREREVITCLSEAELKPGLKALANSGLAEIHGCYFLADLAPEWDVDWVRERLGSATRVECDVHVHVDSYMDEVESNDPVKVFAQGLLFACELRAVLQPRGEFTVTMLYESPGCTTDSDFCDANVRFNKTREGESWLDREHLDHSMNAVLVLDTMSELDSEILQACSGRI